MEINLLFFSCIHRAFHLQEIVLVFSKQVHTDPEDYLCPIQEHWVEGTDFFLCICLCDQKLQRYILHHLQIH